MRKLNLLLLLILLIPFIQCCESERESNALDFLITLQPDATSGKDARVDSWQPDNNLGDRDDLMVKYWTVSGIPTNTRSFLEFDLSLIPTNSEIDSALLSLYHWPDNDHSNLSGSNACWIQRVVEPWQEDVITWNNQPATTTVNQVYVPESVYPTQDYLNIDITQIIKDMIDNPTSSHGLMIMLQTEEAYRSVFFASSDHPNENLRPKLVISYSEIE